MVATNQQLREILIWTEHSGNTNSIYQVNYAVGNDILGQSQSDNQSGFSFGLVQLDIANNDQAMIAYRELLDNALELNRINQTDYQRLQLYTDTRRYDLDATLSQTYQADWDLLDNTVINADGAREIIDRYGDEYIEQDLSIDVNNFLNSIQSKWPEDSVFNESHPDYFAALSAITSLANRFGGLNQTTANFVANRPEGLQEVRDWFLSGNRGNSNQWQEVENAGAFLEETYGEEATVTTFTPERDFLVGTTQNGLLTVDFLRSGDLSFPVDILNDGTVLEPSGIGFSDGVQTAFANQSTFNVGVNLNSFIGSEEDILVEVEYSVAESNIELTDRVIFTDNTVQYLFIGEEVDNQGGQAFGDPHLITFDNVSFDFQAAGEFILVRSIQGDAYEVQVRFKAISSAASVTTAMATSIGSSEVSVEVDGSSGILRVGGLIVDIPLGGTLDIGGGAIARDGRNIEIDHGNGDRTSIDVFSSFLNVTPEPSENHSQRSFEGLLGNRNGTPADDFRLSDGTVLTTPIAVDLLYGEFASSWLVPSSQSLLPGEAEQFVAPERIITIQSLPAELRNHAELVVDASGISNPILREAAILDFALTGSQEFIEAAAITDEKFDPIVDTVAVDPVSNPVIVLATDTNLLSEEQLGAQTATLTVSRGDTQGHLIVNYKFAGFGTSPATSHDFFEGKVSGSVVILDGEEAATFEVTVVDDALDEGPEKFDVEISIDSTQADDFELLVSSVNITIEDDDELSLNLVEGSSGNDLLRGTPDDDILVGHGGRYDRLFGGQGSDYFVFGDEVADGSRDRDVIFDFDIENDAIVLDGSATIKGIRDFSGMFSKPSFMLVTFEGDEDILYIRGENLKASDLNIITDFDLV